MSEELKPCPFCGSKKVGCYESWSLWACQCNECGATMLKRGDKEDAIEAWNQRTERTCRIVPHGHLFTLSDGTELYESACSECGAYLGDEDNYCGACGAKVVG